MLDNGFADDLTACRNAVDIGILRHNGFGSLHALGHGDGIGYRLIVAVHHLGGVVDGLVVALGLDHLHLQQRGGGHQFGHLGGFVDAGGGIQALLQLHVLNKFGALILILWVVVARF